MLSAWISQHLSRVHGPHYGRPLRLDADAGHLGLSRSLAAAGTPTLSGRMLKRSGRRRKAAVTGSSFFTPHARGQENTRFTACLPTYFT